MTERIIERSKKEKYVTEKGDQTKRRKKERKHEQRKWIKLGIWLRIYRQLEKKVHP